MIIKVRSTPYVVWSIIVSLFLWVSFEGAKEWKLPNCFCRVSSAKAKTPLCSDWIAGHLTYSFQATTISNKEIIEWGTLEYILECYIVVATPAPGYWHLLL